MKHHVEYTVALRHPSIPAMGHAIYTQHTGGHPSMLCPVGSEQAGIRRAKAMCAELANWLSATGAEGISCSFKTELSNSKTEKQA